MDQTSFWPSEYPPAFSSGPGTRTVNVGDHKLSLPTQTQSQHPIERFNSGENPLPMGLVPNPVHGFPPMLPAAMPGLTFSHGDPDAQSWHSSIREDDSNSLSADSSSSGTSSVWNQRGSLSLSDYQSSSIPMAFRETPSSPQQTTYQFKQSEVIDPNLTLNYHDSDLCGYKEPPIKFEFPAQCYLGIEDGEYEQDPYTPESPICSQYHHYEHDHAPIIQTPLPTFNTNWVRKVPVTRSQAHGEGRSQQVSTRNSGNGSSKASKSPKSLSPTSNKKIFKRRGSSSGDESPTRNTSRPKTYKKKIPYFTCDEEVCNKENLRFRNRSELKKHIETQHTKPYICIFGFTKCSQRFGARNEWKRHIATQHLMLYKYVCDHPRCRDKPKAKILFNRGDLFMKHLERMHSPPGIYDRKPDDLDLISWKNEMKDAKARCEELRTPPQKMVCGFCDEVFEKGDDTWKELIDHVGLHYQQGDPEVQNGWKDDPNVLAWMRENGLFSDEDGMDLDSETPDSRKSRKHSYASSSESSSARQIKQEQMDA
ncbi:hypothetical protein ABW19_dt0205930 [Dactylella cylindrospora]|nr:hypothetical protein ABW19_dt0205930 [Dactylella cylindrospora]